MNSYEKKKKTIEIYEDALERIKIEIARPQKEDVERLSAIWRIILSAELQVYKL